MFVMAIGTHGPPVPCWEGERASLLERAITFENRHQKQKLGLLLPAKVTGGSSKNDRIGFGYQ